MKTFYLSDEMLKKAKRLKHQSRRLDRIWDQARSANNTDAMSRSLQMQDSVRVRLGIILEVWV